MRKKLNNFLSFDVILWMILSAVLAVIHLKISLFLKFQEPFVIALAYFSTLPVVVNTLKALKNKKISVDLLASIALFTSLAAKEWHSVLFFNLMITSARIFSSYIENKSHSAIESLFKLKPHTARIKKNNEIIEIPIEEIKKGDEVIAELGERVPVDGYVLKGEAEVDQSSLTGESLPVFKKAGDDVLSSTIVKSGNLIVKAVKVGKETTFEKIINLVKEAQKNKAPIAALSNKFATIFIVLTLLGSFLLYILFHNLKLVLSVLLVSCADDLAIAIPLAFLASIGHSARHGAVIKGSDFVEALAKLKVVVVDKTGTLTFGQLKIEEVFSFNSTKKEELLNIAAAVSSFSRHPIAKAIVEYAKKRSVITGEPQDFNEYSGRGTSAVYKNRRIFIGRQSFLEGSKVEISKSELVLINKEKNKGLNTILVGIENELAGFITLADEVRPEIKKTITELKELGIEKVVMLTGDNEKIAERVAGDVGIKEFYANLLPEDKITYLKRYLNNKDKTMMIGDGVNDAAALTLSDIGVAMGVAGSDVAIESADIALMKDEITQIPELIRIGKRTMRIVRQDLLIWGVVNIIGFVLVFTGVLGPEGAVTYNFLGDFLPFINSFRLFR